MALINQRIIKLDVSEIVSELKRLNNNLERIFHVDEPQLTPGVDFDADDYSSVVYSDEDAELVQQHLDNRIGGVMVNGRNY